LSATAADSLDFAITVTSSDNTPDAVVDAVLTSICPDIKDNESLTSNLKNVCNFVEGASPEQITIVNEELSAKANTASSTLTSRTPSLSSTGGIGSRLTALRNSTKKVTELGFRSKTKHRTPNMLSNALSDDTGGGLLSQRLSGFLNINNISSEQLLSDTEIGYESTSRGLLFGMDYRLTHKTFVGLAAQYFNSSAELTDAGSQLDANKFGITLYSTHFINDHWYIEGTLNNSLQQLDLKRQIDIPLASNPIKSIASGDTSSQQLGAYIGSGYDIPLLFGINSALSIGLAYSATNISEYSESNTDNLGLAIDSQSITSLTSYANAYLSRVFSTSLGVLIPQVSATWIHETDSESQEIVAQFVDDASNTKFKFNTPEPDPNYFILGLDLQMVLPQGRMIFLKYTNVRRLRSKKEDTLSAGFRMEF